MWLKLILALVLSLQIIPESNANLNITVHRLPNPTRCITSTIQNNFPCGTLLTLIDTQLYFDNVVRIMNRNNICYSLVVKFSNDTSWLMLTDVYIIMTEDLEEFSKSISELSKNAIWNPTVYCIVEIQTLRTEEIKYVFETLLSHKIYKAILLKHIETNNYKILSYDSFKEDYCGRKFDVIDHGNCSNVSNPFPVTPETLRNCSLKMAVSQNIPYVLIDSNKVVVDDDDVKGIDEYVIEAFAEIEGMKTEIVYVLPEGNGLGVVQKNHTATGLLRYLQINEADITAGGMALIQNRLQMFDAIWGFSFVSLNIYTPPLHGEEVWRIIYTEFDFNTWMFTLVAYCAVASASMIIQIIVLKKISYKALGWIPFALVGYFVSNSSRRLSKDRYHRVIVTFWLWFTFFISNFYCTALYSLLTTHEQTKVVVNEQNLHLLPYEPCISEATRQYLIFDYNQSKPLPSGWNNPLCHHSATALDYVASSGKAYTIEMEHIYKLKEHTFLDEEGHPKLESWKFFPNNVMALYLPRGFPLLHEFQRKAYRLYETGLMMHQLNKIYRNNSRPHAKLHKTHFEPIEINHLEIHFAILSIGMCSGMISFVIELYWGRRYKKVLEN